MSEKKFSADEEFDDSTTHEIKPRVRKRISELRHPRQKFCARWENDFPWLKGDNLDESLGICTICNKHLVCKKSHLERHEKSFKHQRLQGFDSMEFMECGKRDGEDDDEFGNDIEVDPEYSAEFEVKPARKVKSDGGAISKTKTALNVKSVKNTTSSSSAGRNKTTSTKLDRYKLLQRIDRDRNELNEYYYSRRNQFSPTPQAFTAQQPAPRDTFDLFFDSVSASVKQLPPKLAAEVKSRVSQIIAEFELRAICEREALEGKSAIAEVTVASTAHISELSTPTVTQETDPAGGVPHIVYTFQPKLAE